MTLEQVYVGLNATPLSVTFAGQAGEARSVLAAVARVKRLVILGGPGSGKSTLLHFLALRLAQARLEPQGDWLSYLRWPIYVVKKKVREAALNGEEGELLGYEGWPHTSYIPLLVTLRDFAATDFDPASPLALWNFIIADLTSRGLEDAVEAVQAMLVKGEGIFLFDGVDEVFVHRRPQVWQAIGALSRSAFNQCPWITTCRILSYVEKEANAAGEIGRVTLAALEPSQIKAFIKGWYEALAEAGEVTPVREQSLTGQLTHVATGQLRELAENPMLLTIMALVQTYHGILPNERAKLYQACVETLLLRWQRSKEAEEHKLPASLAQLGLKQEIIEPLLWEIGWVAHAEQADRQGAADIPEEQVIALAKKHLGSYAQAEAFVEYTERRAHLLVGVGGVEAQRYSFPHRTLQEYLAGCHLANLRRFGRIASRLAEAGVAWREVLHLAAGTLVYNQKKAGRQILLDALEDILPITKPAPGDGSGWQRVSRAGEMLAIVDVAAVQADEVGIELLPRARDYLAALLSGGELSPPERTEAGQALAILGDPRPGVEVKDEIPDIILREIEAGEFIMGDDTGDENYGEKPAHPVTLAAFKISQYPITNAQFMAFVSNSGYQKENYWREAKEEDYWQVGKFKGYWDNEARDRPFDFGQPFNLANHPVVGVTWYEVVAFCRWLSEKLDCLVRLPTEAEWEKAARGVAGMKYPWGNEEETAKRCNMEVTGIDTTSAVGIFPNGASPYEIFDMSGNVWEWFSTIWDKKAYPFQVMEEWTEVYLKGTGARALRGAAFTNAAISVRCASRNGNNPSGGGR